MQNNKKVYSTSHYVDGPNDDKNNDVNTTAVNNAQSASDTTDVKEYLLDAPNPYPDYAYPKRKDPRNSN